MFNSKLSLWELNIQFPQFVQGYESYRMCKLGTQAQSATWLKKLFLMFLTETYIFQRKFWNNSQVRILQIKIAFLWSTPTGARRKHQTITKLIATTFLKWLVFMTYELWLVWLKYHLLNQGWRVIFERPNQPFPILFHPGYPMYGFPKNIGDLLYRSRTVPEFSLLCREHTNYDACSTTVQGDRQSTADEQSPSEFLNSLLRKFLSFWFRF